MTDDSQDAPTQQPNSLLILIGINIGIKLQNAGKFKKALRCFIYVLEADSSRVDVWYRIGNCWQNLGYFEDAIASYNACYQRSLLQQNIWLQAISQFCLGQCYVSLQQQDQAILAYRLAYQLFSQVENTPYTQQAWDYLDKVGNELLNNQQFESAIQYYQSLLEVVKLVNNQQNLSSVLQSLGKVYYWQNQDELAIECHREMLDISRRLSDGEMENTALRWLTCETWRLGQMETAIEYFKQRLGVIQRLQRPQEQPEVLDWIIKGYKQLNQLENTIDYYQQKLELLREKQDFLTEYQTLYELGGVSFNLKQYPLAIDCFQAGLNLEPSLEQPYYQANLNYMLGLIYLDLNQSSEAIASFEKAVTVYEQQEQSQEWVIRASEYLEKLYQQTEDFEKLIPILEKRLTRLRASQDRSNEYSLLYKIAGLYYQLKNYSQAGDYYKSALGVAQGLTPRQPGLEANAYYMLGLMCQCLQRWEEGLSNYREALRFYTELNNPEWVEHSRNKVQELERILASRSSVSISQSDPQLDFLLNVLQAVADSQGNPQIVYPLLQQNLDQLDENLADLLTKWATAKFKEVPIEEATYIAAVIVDFGDLIQQFPLGSRKNNLEISIAAYQAALEIRTRVAFPKQWATTQNNRALAYSDRIKGDKAENIEQAITGYQAALEIRTREAFPKDWAMTQYNLALAYRNRIKGGKADNIERAIAAYQDALEILTREAFPEDWAKTQHNLAFAYWNRIKGEKADNLERAIVAYQDALEILTREVFPKQWARTQNNLAIAYLDRIKGEKADNLESAIAFFQATLEIRTREAFPEQWAESQNNLAIAYLDRIKGEKADNIERAIAAYQVALEIRTREAFPQDWAATQNNLGNAYSDRIKGKKADNLEQAIITYQAALEIRTREAFPEDWAGTQNNLAAAYYDRIKGEKADNIEQAIAFYQAALEIYTREAFPEQWAMTQMNLANAYNNRIKGEKADNIERAIVSHQAALEIYTREAFPEQWAKSQNNLAAAYVDRIKGEKADNLERAIAAYQDALEIRTREAFPEQWATTQMNLANAYNNRIKGEKADNLERAIIACQDALKIYTREAFPEQWATTQMNLANAYWNRIEGGKSDNIKRAIIAYKATLEIYTPEAFPYNYLQTAYNLGLTYQKSQQWQLAYDTFYNAIETLEEIRAGIVKGGDADKQKLAEQWQKLYQGMVEVCIELKNYTAAIEYVERSKTRNLVELLATRDLYPKGDIPQTVLDELDRLRRDIETEQRRLEIEERTRNRFGDGTTGERSPNIAALQTPPPDRSRLNELRQQLDTLITRDITPKDPDFLLTQKVKPIPFSDIQGLTGDNTAILEWYILSDRFVVFIVTPPPLTPAYQRGEPEISEPPLLRGAGGIKPSELSEDPPLTPPYQRGELQTSEPPLLRGAGGIKPSELSEDPPLTPPYQRGELENSEPPFLRGAGGIKLWQSTPEDYNALRAWADDYLTAYRTDKKQWQNTLNSRLQRLGEILHFDQLLKAIGEKCDSLVLIPNHFLHLFPLHALPISQDRLGESTSSSGVGARRASPVQESIILMDLFSGGVSYAPSCQLLQTAKNRQCPDFSQLFAIQNPTEDLAYTDLEVNSIRTYFNSSHLVLVNPSHILVRKNAKKSTFNEQQNTLKTANCHHFSCHGYFNFENPILSALLFADCYLEPAPSPLDPSRHLRLEKGQTLDLSECLTLGDVFTLDLRCCRLVTLSACETGLIDFQSNSDEYIGLPSGFLVAGSTNVVSSLWAVSDISTAILMIKFYQLLREGEEVAIALNHAQNWLRNATKAELLAWIDLGNKMQLRKSLKEINDHDKPFASPYYWAAFCAIGKF